MASLNGLFYMQKFAAHYINYKLINWNNNKKETPQHCVQWQANRHLMNIYFVFIKRQIDFWIQIVYWCAIFFFSIWIVTTHQTNIIDRPIHLHCRFSCNQHFWFDFFLHLMIRFYKSMNVNRFWNFINCWYSCSDKYNVPFFYWTGRFTNDSRYLMGPNKLNRIRSK